MSSFEMMLEADNVTLPSLHAPICNHPNFLCDLINEPEIMTYQHKATVPLCIGSTTALVKGSVDSTSAWHNLYTFAAACVGACNGSIYQALSAIPTRQRIAGLFGAACT